MSSKSIQSNIIVALDYPDADSALAMADRLDARQCRVKVGKELFTRAGPQVVRDLQKRDFEVFLDLKYHDIPNTVAGACRAAADLGVWMFNVHASGGEAMMLAARQALADDGPLLIAVTVLTSLDETDLAEIGVSANPAAQVLRLATLAESAGLDGVVCSPTDLHRLRESVASNFLAVTPGVRPVGASSGDQKRVATPAKALADGANYLVIGRPITAAADPMLALNAILTEIRAS